MGEVKMEGQDAKEWGVYKIFHRKGSRHKYQGRRKRNRKNIERRE